MNTDQDVSAIISTFRANYTVFQLERIQRVTGEHFAVSGDAPLRHQRRMMKQRMNAEYAKAVAVGERESSLMLKLRLNAEAAEIGNRIYNDTDSLGESE